MYISVVLVVARDIGKSREAKAYADAVNVNNIQSKRAHMAEDKRYKAMFEVVNSKQGLFESLGVGGMLKCRSSSLHVAKISTGKLLRRLQQKTSY